MRRVGERPLTKVSRWGPVTWTRPYGVCPDGHGGHGKGDTVLGVGSARVMPEVAQAMAWCGAAGAVDQAADTLTRLWQVAVDGETLRRVVEQVGTVAEARERATTGSIHRVAICCPTRWSQATRSR